MLTAAAPMLLRCKPASPNVQDNVVADNIGSINFRVMRASLQGELLRKAETVRWCFGCRVQGWLPRGSAHIDSVLAKAGWSVARLSAPSSASTYTFHEL